MPDNYLIKIKIKIIILKKSIFGNYILTTIYFFKKISIFYLLQSIILYYFFKSFYIFIRLQSLCNICTDRKKLDLYLTPQCSLSRRLFHIFSLSLLHVWLVLGKMVFFYCVLYCSNTQRF